MDEKELKQFIEVVKVFMEHMGPEKIEMRWRQKYDGDTRWHSIKDEHGVLGLGLFPWQAEYRIKKNKKA